MAATESQRRRCRASVHACTYDEFQRLCWECGITTQELPEISVALCALSLPTEKYMWLRIPKVRDLLFAIARKNTSVHSHDLVPPSNDFGTMTGNTCWYSGTADGRLFRLFAVCTRIIIRHSNRKNWCTYPGHCQNFFWGWGEVCLCMHLYVCVNI